MTSEDFQPSTPAGAVRLDDVLAGVRRASMELTQVHREILSTIGEAGASAERLRRHGREFGELSAAHLIVLWPTRGHRPASIYGGGVVPGRWYLTIAGAEAVGLEPPALRLI